MNRVVVIINPVSGPARRGTGSERADLATRALDRLGERAEIRLTERAGHAHEMAIEAAASGAEIVMAWGGDGTINDVGRALVQRADEAAPDQPLPALGIIPGGSGNGLARELGIPFDPERAIERCMRAQTRRVDAGELGNRLFFNVAGVGLDAHVAALVSTGVHHRGLLPYLSATVRDLLAYVPVEYSITADGETFEMSALIVAVANSRQYGFGAQIAPRASFEDGFLDLVVVEDRRMTGNLARIPSLFLARVDRQSGVKSLRVREATIRSRKTMLFHVDGEAEQGSDALVARVHPGALRLRA